MQKRVISIVLASAAGAAVAAGALRPHDRPATPPVSAASLAPAAAQASAQQPAVRSVPSPAIASDVARWQSLRQSDSHPFSAYASFLTSHRGWPGETALRRAAERQIDPATVSAAEVVRFFSIYPPLTAAGHARYAVALLANGETAAAQRQGRAAWLAGAMPQNDENRILGAFGPAFTAADHDARMDVLLDNRDLQSAQRLLASTSIARRPVFEARLAFQTRAADAAAKAAAAGAAGAGDAGFVMDQANWLRNSGQAQASRDFLAQPRTLTRHPGDAESYLETLLTMARAAAGDGQWPLAYAIASRAVDAFPAGTDVTQRTMGERDDFTSLVWLAGTTALKQLGRPADAEAMFVRYAEGGRSLQVLTKGRYWAGRAAQAAGRTAEATAHYAAAGAYPELFYAQLSLEKIGRPIPAPQAAALPLGEAERLAFNHRSIVQATRWLGQAGRWADQSVFVRTLSEGLENDRDRQLAVELSRTIGRPDLSVWIARSARNSGSSYYVRSSYPQFEVPPANARYWSLSNGIMRQESSFDRAAVSHAGARGMMQLMPPTAREVSGRLGVGYSFDRLTSDPDYNILLGSSYVSTLMNQWGGNVVLTAASYNAGAGNVRRWLRENGDPRMPHVDIIDWIEQIPFSETRGYVQRVIENSIVYDSMNPARAMSPERTRASWYLGTPGQLR